MRVVPNTTTGDSPAPVHQEAVLPRLLTSRQLSELLSIPERTAWRYWHSGLMPAPLKIGSLVRFDRDEILAWIENDCKPVDGRADR
jgi:excisionase family DNA binding protein